MYMVEKILNNTTPYGKIRASHEGSLHSSTLSLSGGQVNMLRFFPPWGDIFFLNEKIKSVLFLIYGLKNLLNE